jgi:hypothetical protein
MRLAIIISNENKNLVKFTETKLFFDEKNKSINFFDDCLIVNNVSDVEKYKNLYESIFIIETGYFLTSDFRKKYENFKGILFVEKNNPDVIIFDYNTIISLTKKSHYKKGSKQLYIIENLLKVLINHKKLIYYDNTENYIRKDYQNIKHFYGLASGWKSYRLIKDIGIFNLESITIFDYNPVQLAYAKQMHKNPILPDSVNIIKNSVELYKKPIELIDFWNDYSKYNVEFNLINLFELIKFKENSLIWISNIFNYEPNIFNFGWEASKKQKNNLITNNPSCIIIEN